MEFIVDSAAVTSQYEKKGELGSGTFGVVHDAIRKSDNLRVAIKRNKPMNAQQGVNFTAMREINYLQDLRSPYVVELIDVFLTGDSLHMVLEYCPFDMKDVIYDKKIFFDESIIKSYVKMMLQGMEVCHRNFVLHRDMKPANVLIGTDGVLKLADFGFARKHSSPRNMTSEVVTMAYRCPELLFESLNYGGGVDVWSIGCIFAELILRNPLFPGTSVVDTLAKIFNVLGTPSEQSWPGVGLLPSHITFEQFDPIPLSNIFGSKRGAGTIDLLQKMLTLDPQKRISVSQALAHPYFTSAPDVTDPKLLPKPTKV